MTTNDHISAPTRFVEANGVRYAYRRFGAGIRNSAPVPAAPARRHGQLGPRGHRRPSRWPDGHPLRQRRRGLIQRSDTGDDGGLRRPRGRVRRRPRATGRWTSWASRSAGTPRRRWRCGTRSSCGGWSSPAPGRAPASMRGSTRMSSRSRPARGDDPGGLPVPVLRADAERARQRAENSGSGATAARPTSTRPRHRQP